MTIKGRKISFLQLVCLALYYGIGRYLPNSTTPIFGKVAKMVRRLLCKRIFKYCGENVNIERMANFGIGTLIEIDDNSGLGINSCVPNGTRIGKNVMMGPNFHAIAHNHIHERTDIPMTMQGIERAAPPLIENDVWIGRNVTLMPGRTIKSGTIVAACACVTKDFPEYSVIGGVLAKLIKSRK